MGKCTNRRPRGMHLKLQAGLLDQALDIGDLLGKRCILGANLPELSAFLVNSSMFYRIDRPGSVRNRLYIWKVLPEPGSHRSCPCY